MILKLLVVLCYSWIQVYATYNGHQYNGFHYNQQYAQWHQHSNTLPQHNVQHFAYQNIPQHSDVTYHFYYPQQQTYHREYSNFHNGFQQATHQQHIYNTYTFGQNLPNGFVNYKIMYNIPHRKPAITFNNYIPPQEETSGVFCKKEATTTEKSLAIDSEVNSKELTTQKVVETYPVEITTELAAQTSERMTISSTECLDCENGKDNTVEDIDKQPTADLEVTALDPQMVVEANTLDVKQETKPAVPPIFWRFG